ncbi:MAG: FtsW/RodA/SpoVE family cell cycle protein [Clostridia bacterium]|nr:FtsW/RodA/SpoVE family cell cycle protein [Clostridia bacterium]
MLNSIGKYIKDCIKSIDPILFVCTVLLSAISIMTVFGAMDNFGKRKLIMQIAMTAAGIIATLIIANLDYHLIVDKLWLFMIGFSALLLIITLVFGSSGENMETSNQSWLRIPGIGIMIQPSEFIKITMVCSYAKHISLVRERINHPKELIGLAIHAGLIVGLILISGDLGVALVYMAFLLIMLFVAGMSGWYFLGGAATVALAFPLIWEHLAPYQKERIIVGFDPELDPMGKGMQPLMSKMCIENGGLFGIGLMGKGHYEDLPASHTDFIFATVCEKFGIAGGILVVVLLAVMVVRVFMIAHSCGQDYGCLICVGVGAILVVQTLENVGMCLAMLPVVGLTLPFLSCGGSSVLATYVLLSLVHSVKGHRSRARGGYGMTYKRF